MTRADTAERTLIPTELKSSKEIIFYFPGSMLVILLISNITVDDLHYGIFTIITAERTLIPTELEPPTETNILWYRFYACDIVLI